MLLSALGAICLHFSALLPAEKRIERLPIKLQIATPQMLKQSPTRKRVRRIHYAECVIRVHSRTNCIAACCHLHRPPESAAQQLIRQSEISRLRNACFAASNRLGGTIAANSILDGLSAGTDAANSAGGNNALSGRTGGVQTEAAEHVMLQGMGRVGSVGGGIAPLRPDSGLAGIRAFAFQRADGVEGRRNQAARPVRVAVIGKTPFIRSHPKTIFSENGSGRGSVCAKDVRARPSGRCADGKSICLQ